MVNKMVHIFFNKVLGENAKKCLSFLLEKQRKFLVSPIHGDQTVLIL